MTTKNKKIYSKILSSCIVLTMILTGFVTFFNIEPAAIAAPSEQLNTDVPSIRVYGEDNAVYPTHSYYGEDDFFYKDQTDPFDPGILAKDSITFNSAYIGHNDDQYSGMKYGVTNYDKEPTGELASNNADEKIFYRVFYEPGYYHESDELLNGQSAVGPFDAVVSETTYMLIDHATYDSCNGIPGDPVYGLPEGTSFMFPYKSSNPDKPGMEEATVVDLVDANNQGSTYSTDGKIDIQIKEFNLPINGKVHFLDHHLELLSIHRIPTDTITVAVSYDGNMYGEGKSTETHDQLDKNTRYYFDRHNDIVESDESPGPHYRWYLEFSSINEAPEDTVNIKVGRELWAGETFYVDGVRYDMPAIWVEKHDCHSFSYITLQSPMPKYDFDGPIWEISDERRDFSHVSSQWLANLLPNEKVWVLPPFNENHIMIDDIGLDKYQVTDKGACNYIIDFPEGRQLNGLRGELDYTYIDETIEPRFNTSLAERLDVEWDNYGDATDKPGDEQYTWDESWDWYSIYTKPNKYTEFLLPNQEDPNINGLDKYVDNVAPYDTVDGSEYLLTSSFIAKNSDVDTDRCDELECKENHEIFDRSCEIALGADVSERDIYYEEPRMVFEFDAHNGEDLYVNTHNGKPTVRIYGEDDYIYPTHSWGLDSFDGQGYNGENIWYDFTHYEYSSWEDYLQGDFVYPHYSYPFYPGSVPKDSITFNPAIIKHEYDGKGDTIIADDINAHEKVYFRAFYEPGYDHGPDHKMSSSESVGPFDAVVTETTYFLIDTNYQPIAGRPDHTQFMLPYKSSDSNNPGMEEGIVVDLVDASCGPGEWYNGQPDILTDGNIDVQVGKFSKPMGYEFSFMDHRVRLVSFNRIPENNITVEVAYVGNMNPNNEDLNWELAENLECGERYYFNRHNNVDQTSGPHYRWYIEPTTINYDDTVNFKVGRELYAGETFYVDGVRYDMPAIYVEPDSGVPKFKYITFQTPMPKYDPDGPIWEISTERKDFSHVSSQWLANLIPNYNVWMLPPFNHQHYMVDDINFERYDANYPGTPDWEIDYPEGLVIQGKRDPLEFYYHIETKEPRFDTSLAERLQDESCDFDWTWYNIYTKPYKYTEFVLPDDEMTDDVYEKYPYKEVDGSEYIITSSWIAPNCEDSEIDELSKSSYEIHDIFDIISIDLDWLDKAPRVSFSHDGVDDTGIYINEREPVDLIPEACFNFDFTCDCDGGCGGCACDADVEFDASCSYDPDNNPGDDGIISYHWDFGDGTTGTGKTITHTYEDIPENGVTYPVTLTVTDDDTQTDVETKDVSIDCPDDSNTIEAVDDNAKTSWNECVIIDVLGNDAGTGLEITDVTNPSISGATTEIVSDTIRYCTPSGSGSDTDTFDYIIEDDYGQTDIATVTVYITEVAICIQDISVQKDACTGCEEWNRVTIDSDEAVGRVSLNITWNPDHIHVSEVQKNDIDWDYWPGFDASTLPQGYINITAINSNEGVTGDGIEVLRLKMSGGSQADEGQTYPVNVEWCVVKDTTIPPNQLPATVSPGSVSILGDSQYIIGDMDADNDQTQDDLDVDDLYVMARIVFDGIEPLPNTNGDLDDDGDIDIDDLYILAVWVFN